MKLNIIVSSWPSSGGTTIALIWAKLLNIRYLYAGGVIKEWSARMGMDPTTDAFHTFEEKYGEVWDNLWEEYIQVKFKAETGLLCEGKTAGFLLPPHNAFEVMVIADQETRSKRAGNDQRTEIIAERDHYLKERWLRLFKVDIFSLTQIEANYDLVLDNSNLNIADSLNSIWLNLKIWASNNKLDIEKYNISTADFIHIETQFWTDQKSGISGKDRLKNSLQQSGLYISAEEVFTEWKSNYSELLKNIPQELLKVI